MSLSTKPRTTKKAQLIKLLGTKASGDIATLSDKLGWQPHTTRAAMSGLRKDGLPLLAANPREVGLLGTAFIRNRSPLRWSCPVGHDPNPERPEALSGWNSAFGAPPPPYLSVSFMQRAVGYQKQCKKSGDLPTATQRTLRQIAQGDDPKAAIAPTLNPDAHLVREWNGRTYQVHVVEDGFELDGKVWKSLSAIAKHITGATWSGPRFFGLNAKVRSSQ